MDIELNKLKRDYIKDPLKKIKINTPTGYTYEKPYKEDLEYLYIELNMSTKELMAYFNITKRILQRWIKIYNIKKPKEKRIENSIKNMITIDRKLSAQKSKQTKLKRYGNENYNNRKKSRITCLEVFGVENVNQRHLSKETIKIISNKIELLKYIKENNIINATDLANHLGMSEPQVARYIVNYDFKHFMEYSKSVAEKEIREYVNQYYKTENNTRNIIPPYELDIYIPKINKAIEYNGDYWHNLSEDMKNKDIIKRIICKNKGIDLLVIWEHEYKSDKNLVYKKINEFIKINIDNFR